jgi:ferredoxin
VKITVDRDLCQGHGVCESEAPGIFQVSQGGVLEVLDQAPPEDRRAEVAAAVRYCPTSALTIQED